MTSLIYYMGDEQVCIACDTLMSHVDGSPFHYVTKIMLLPHLRGVVCGTGSADLLLRWYNVLQEQAVLPSLAWIRDQTPSFLQRLAAELRLPVEAKSTLYHFAWNASVGRIEGRSFSLAENFAPRALPAKALVVKPGYPGVNDDAELIFANGVGGFAEIMSKQRGRDNALPPKDRAQIGGEVHFVEVTKDHVFQVLSHRFADYDDLYEQMCAALRPEDRL